MMDAFFNMALHKRLISLTFGLEFSSSICFQNLRHGIPKEWYNIKFHCHHKFLPFAKWEKNFTEINKTLSHLRLSFLTRIWEHLIEELPVTHESAGILCSFSCRFNGSSTAEIRQTNSICLDENLEHYVRWKLVTRETETDLRFEDWIAEQTGSYFFVWLAENLPFRLNLNGAPLGI